MRTPWSRSSRISQLVTLGGLLAALFALAPGVHAQSSPEATSRSLVNSARAAVGLPALGDDSRLDTIARAQAQRMADRDAIYHNPDLKSDADAAGVHWQWIGENVGVGPDAQSIHNGFMASPSHHENIVYRDYNVLGVGAAVGKDGSIFIVQDYAGLVASPPPAPKSLESAAPAPVAAAPAAPSTPAAAPAATVAPSPASRVEVAPSVVTQGPDANAVTGGVVDEVVRL